jgi:hypothetical protein
MQFRTKNRSSGDARPTPAATPQKMWDLPAVNAGAASSSPQRDMQQLRKVLNSMVRESVLSPQAMSVVTQNVTAEQQRRETLERYRLGGR